MVGGFGSNGLPSVELFPRPPSGTCFIPDLPQARHGHSLSLLSGGRLVVCGGYSGVHLDSCISWVAGYTSWTPLHTMRCLIPIMLHNHFHNHRSTLSVPIMLHNQFILITQSQHGENLSHGLDAALSSRLHRAAGRRWQCNTVHCRDCARYFIEQRQASNPIPGGATFSLSHSGHYACGIPDGETLILTGGNNHSFVTR